MNFKPNEHYERREKKEVEILHFFQNFVLPQTKQKRFMIIIVEDTRLLSCTFHCVGSRLLTIIYKKNTGLNFSHSGVFLPFKLEFSMSFKCGMVSKNSSNHCRKLFSFSILGVNVYNICMQ